MAKSKSYGGLIALLVVLAAGGAGIWYYFGKAADKAPEFQTTKVARGDITQSVTATGDLQPVVTVDVSSQISGQVSDVLVDFNSKVKAGDILARIDPSTYQQNLKQAEADLASTNANNQLLRLNAQRTRELFEKKLVAKQDLDNADAQLAQSDATVLTRTAAVENAKVNLGRCTIYAPIDGMVLNRLTDKGRTVAASLNAPTLFTLVNDLSKMQIQAAVAEADIGSISEGQDVQFTVDAFPNRTFRGTVAQVRNNATTQSSVVSYATIISVNNDDLKLKPGMTANVSIIVAQRPNVLRVANSALRVRLPAELQPKAPAAAPSGDSKAAPVAMSEDEKRRALMETMRDSGWQMGAPLSPEVIEKAKKAATDKGLTADDVTQFVTRMQQRMAQGGGGGGPGAGGGRGGGGGGRGGSNSGGFTNVIATRTLYKLTDPAAKEKKIESASVRLGISDGFFTEVLNGLNEGDTLVTGVIMPNAAPILQAPGGTQNPFQGGGGRGPGMGGMGGGGGRGR